MDSFDFHFGGLWTDEMYRRVFTPGQLHVKPAKSWVEFAVIEDQGQREYMEDTYWISDGFAGSIDSGLFCIFDGHGGNKIWEFVKTHFVEEFDSSLKKAWTRSIQVADTLRDWFYIVNENLPDKFNGDQGSTACICLIVTEDEEKVLYVSNVGDTRAITTIEGVVKQLTDDHNVKNSSEVERIIKGGGKIFNSRVGGRLVVTRAFGDIYCKNDGLTVDPLITKYNFEDLGNYLIIWTDGIYDRLSNEEVMSFWNPEFSTLEIWENIMNEAIKIRKSKDNWWWWVIKLK